MSTALPFLQQYAGIQNLVDYGRGLAANVVGQPGSIYRMNTTVNGDYVQTASLEYTNFPVLRRVINEATSLETHEKMGLVFYEVICNLNLLKVGDIWIQTDPFYGAGADIVTYPTAEFVGLVLVHHAVMTKALAIQVHRYAYIYRMLGGTGSGGYFNTYQQQAAGFTLVNGVGSFVPNGAPSQIPIGLQPRTGGHRKAMTPDIPGETPETEFTCYIPPIDGYAPLEGDIIETANGSRYVVIVPWHLEAGVVGNSVLLRRMNPQTQNAGAV